MMVTINYIEKDVWLNLCNGSVASRLDRKRNRQILLLNFLRKFPCNYQLTIHAVSKCEHKWSSVLSRAYSKCTRAWHKITVRRWGVYQLSYLQNFIGRMVYLV
jgi:hypothetical protein